MDLTATEFKLLMLLAQRRGRVQSRDQLLRERQIVGAIHLAHAAASEQTEHAVAAVEDRPGREASVVDAPSIGPKTAGRLHVIGVKTVGDLLQLSADDAAKQIKASHINAQVIRDWQAQALLVDWEGSLRKMVKVLPSEYRRVIAEQAKMPETAGLVGDIAPRPYQSWRDSGVLRAVRHG